MWYAEICKEVAEFKMFDIKEFIECFALTYSRVFSLDLPNGEKTCLIPFADMFNHDDQPAARGYYDKDKNGVVVKALRDIQNGTEITIKYAGIVNNLTSFLSGFTYDSIKHNETHLSL